MAGRKVSFSKERGPYRVEIDDYDIVKDSNSIFAYTKYHRYRIKFMTKEDRISDSKILREGWVRTTDHVTYAWESPPKMIAPVGMIAITIDEYMELRSLDLV